MVKLNMSMQLHTRATRESMCPLHCMVMKRYELWELWELWIPFSPLEIAEWRNGEEHWMLTLHCPSVPLESLFPWLAPREAREAGDLEPPI